MPKLQYKYVKIAMKNTLKLVVKSYQIHSLITYFNNIMV
jgi:hypothetical protein